MLTTGDGRPLPSQLKAQISRELDRLELVLEQIKACEQMRDVRRLRFSGQVDKLRLTGPERRETWV